MNAKIDLLVQLKLGDDHAMNPQTNVLNHKTAFLSHTFILKSAKFEHNSHPKIVRWVHGRDIKSLG